MEKARVKTTHIARKGVPGAPAQTGAAHAVPGETVKQFLWRAYCALQPHDKIFAQLLALIGHGLHNRDLFDVVAELPDGKQWGLNRVNQAVASLKARKLFSPEHGCAVEVWHEVAVDAAEGKDGEKLLDAVRKKAPRSFRQDRFGYAYQHRQYQSDSLSDDWLLLRGVRFAVYANDETEFLRLANILMASGTDMRGPAALNACLSALPTEEAEKAWFEGRKPAIQEALKANCIRSLVDFGLAIKDQEAVTARCGQEAPRLLSAGLNKLLLRRNIFRFDFDQALRRSTVLAEANEPYAASCAASVDFLTGNNAQAVDTFRNALKRFRKAEGRRKLAFGEEPGLFHMLSLLRANTGEARKELQSLIDATGFPHEYSPHYPAYGAIQGLLHLAAGDETAARQSLQALHLRWPSHFLNAAIAALAEMVIDIDASRARAKANEQQFERLAGHLPLPARIYAEILSKTAENGEVWRKRVAELGGDGVVAFSGVVGLKARWERAFDNLAAFLNPEEASVAPARSAAPKARRLVWLVSATRRSVEPIEQSAKGTGWSAGRAVALKRLHERDSKLNYLTEHDHKVLRCIRKEKSWAYDCTFHMDEYAALPALVGHPHVFDMDDRSRNVDLAAYPVELVVRETPEGYNFNLSHYGETRRIFIEEETPTRWLVVNLTETLVQLQASLGREGLTVPREMRDRVVELLKNNNPTVPIRSELADVDVPAIEGDATPVLQLQRLGDGLKVNIVTRPFGAEGPFYLAGQGGRSVLAEFNGVRQRANRDLDREKAGMQALVAASPSLEPWRASDHEWCVESLEDSLEFLNEAQSYGEPVHFEWPEGQALKVTRPVAAQKLSIKLAQKRDWFEVSGRIAVDEDLLLDMKDLLSRLGKARGRFVPLDGGRFVTLEQDFLRQLGRLEGVSEEAGDGRRLHGLAAMAVEELIESAGKVSADKHWKELNARIKAAGRHSPEVPSTLQTELRDYQAEGFCWLSRLANLQMGACLADDMGLGKTVQTIAVMIEQQAKGACLVVAPTSVCHNWESELARFAPTLTAHRLAAAGDRAALIGRMGPGDVLITSYGLLHQEDETLTGRAWNMVVFDEAQNLKNSETKRAKASQKLEAKFKVALSGTPIENYLEELWSLFNTINPGLLGSREGFQKRFAGPIERDRRLGPRDALRTLIRPFILRRTKAAVLNELPPRTELTVAVQQQEEERAFYEAVRQKAMENIASLQGPPGARKIHILAEISKLRRACCHPALIDPGTTLDSAKLKAFLGLIDDLLRNRHKALVFSQFLGHLEKVRKALDAKGVRYQYIDGSVPAQQRAERVAAFQGGEGDLFLISLKAGGTGLNLTAADYVIHLDPWWNPAVEDQASDRAHRIGQSRPVTVYRLVVEDSIEERILELHKHKRDLAADLLDGAEVSGRLSEDELIALIGG